MVEQLVTFARCPLDSVSRTDFETGIFTSTGPLFLAELSLPENRGRILSFQQWSITWGVSGLSRSKLEYAMPLETETLRI